MKRTLTKGWWFECVRCCTFIGVCAVTSRTVRGTATGSRSAVTVTDDGARVSVPKKGLTYVGGICADCVRDAIEAGVSPEVFVANPQLELPTGATDDKKE